MNVIQALQEKTSPMMQQWSRCKRDSHGAMLLFRMGDFYEAFHEDAISLARELSVTLTQRQSIPMAGVPACSLDSALEKLSMRGLRIAVAEQVEDPRQAKGLVDRQVVRIVTPGTFTPAHDAGKTHNWVVCLVMSPNLALAACDISTCDVGTCHLQNPEDLETHLQRLRPKEILVDQKTLENLPQLHELSDSLGAFIQILDTSLFDLSRSQHQLHKHFSIHSVDSLGLKDLPGSTRCLGALMSYLGDQLRLPLDALRSIQIFVHDNVMHIDRSSQKNLEITQPLFEGHAHNTLLHHLDKTQTPMGSRLLREWLTQPLKKVELIQARGDAIEEILSQPHILSELRTRLQSVRDLKRLSTKIICKSASPRDLASLRSSLGALPKIHNQLQTLHRGLWKDIEKTTIAIPGLYELLQTALCDEPALRVGEGPIIRSGYNERLDELRSLREQGHAWMNTYQTQLKESFGIKNLKVAYTPAFGYYIEVSKGQASLMPAQFTRRQTLVSSERFVSPELKEFEDKVLHAQERMQAIEYEVLEKLREAIEPHCPTIDNWANALAQCDCLLSLTEVARTHSYIRPIIDNSDELDIVGGRHPIVEEMIGHDKFISNDTKMGSSHGRMMIITGPNMAGKSTYIRQVALLVLMAQIGSFVPVKSMRLGIIDRIFTRVGASDDLARGQSTFMVEMSETSNILHHATDNSLVILDEVGRGTSTYDGIAIARSIAEYLLTEPHKRPKTLFATHYSELTDLSTQFPQARNYRVLVKEWRDEIIFMHQISEGAADRSYGIHVARLAGLPSSVIKRARLIQSQLETSKNKRSTKTSGQFDLFQHPPVFQPPEKIESSSQTELLQIKEKLEGLDINQTTPIQAFMFLQELLESWKKITTYP